LSRLYVGNLAHETTEVDLRAAFSRFGEVVSARVMSNRRGRTKEFGYVEMADEALHHLAQPRIRTALEAGDGGRGDVLWGSAAFGHWGHSILTQARPEPPPTSRDAWSPRLREVVPRALVPGRRRARAG